MRVGTRLANVEVEAFERVVDMETLEPRSATHAERNDVVEVVFRSREALAVDTVDAYPGLARFILLSGVDVVAGGTILATFPNANTAFIVPVGHLVNHDARAARNGHRGAVIWLTGLPAAGKSTIAMQVERRLHERGVQSYVLDGDNLRTGLCRDLGFSETDRSENIRRVGEVATLFADAGLVAITAFISPRRSDREIARAIAGERFHEVFIQADPAVCESRDPKGHYARARAGEIPNFTGISGEYEAPLDPDLVIDTQALTLDVAVSALLEYILGHIGQLHQPPVGGAAQAQRAAV
jgi:bifunctional enzyme CysN/CysC